MTANQANALIENELEKNGNVSFKAEAKTILEHILVKPYYKIVLEPSHLGQLEKQKLNSILKRRLNKEPLQYILGGCEFYGISLKLNKNVLIPRVETETLVELAVKASPACVLDLGAGSGAIALAIKANLPNSTVAASDISLKALEIAQENAQRNNLTIEFFHSDLLKNKDLAEFAKSVDVVVANLPYLPASDKLDFELLAFEPAAALFSGADGLDLFRRLEQQAFELLKPKAWLFCELDSRNIEKAHQLSNRWAEREIIRDILGRKRFLKLIK